MYFYSPQAIHTKVVLAKERCPLCLQMRAAAIQGSFGFVVPTLLSTFSGLMVNSINSSKIHSYLIRIQFYWWQFATRHYTYRIPSITSEPLEVFKLWMKFTKPIKNTIITFIAFNCFAGMFITYKEIESFWRIQSILEQAAKDNELVEGNDGGNKWGGFLCF